MWAHVDRQFLNPGRSVFSVAKKEKFSGEFGEMCIPDVFYGFQKEDAKQKTRPNPTAMQVMRRKLVILILSDRID